jgi:LuxR family quorum-sensing system transcriptional regulator CciR
MTVHQAQLTRRAFDALVDMPRCASAEDLDSVAAPVLGDLGIPLFGWGRFFGARGEPETAFLSGRWSSRWTAFYLEQGYGARSMITRTMLSTASPYCWHEVIRRGLDPITNEIVNEARGFGLRDGLFFPMRAQDGGYSAVAFCAVEADFQDPLLRKVTEVMAAYYGREAARLLTPAKPGPSQLSPRQRECLAWVRQGKSSADIGDILGLSVPTVDGHIAEACRKFGVRTRVQAVVEACLSGQIDR